MVSIFHIFCLLSFICYISAFSWLSDSSLHGDVNMIEHSLQDHQKHPTKPQAATSSDLLDSAPQPPTSEPNSYDSQQDPSTFSTLLSALSTMQSHYFHIWPGTWPSAIDWNAAVMSTHVSATLSAITASIGYTTEGRSNENMINQYFTQIASFYHGENAFSLRTQAYDDMLWVVLGWLEGVKFIKLHSLLHYSGPYGMENPATKMSEVNVSRWYAQQFIPQFAHRAHVFYDLASQGWDISLCGGGMVWNPYLAPYKNAITNELFIAASVSMYLYFPGDDNPSPLQTHFVKDNSLPPAKAHDVRYLESAIKAYDWLKQSNMTNSQGLYVDGFHIRNWRGGQNSSRGTGQCDLRDEKVYTYNQGVILSGLRGLWDATSSLAYLQDGHELVRNVIKATGWENRDADNPWVRYRWAGLGRNGIMEDACDASGSCSQDGQTFKGIWWHHFSIFCAPLVRKDDNERTEMEEEAETTHRSSCQGYEEWVRRNAHAAKQTRNERGEYGSWWGKHPWQWADKELREDEDDGTDYRNRGIPDNEIWRLPEDEGVLHGFRQPAMAGLLHRQRDPVSPGQQVLEGAGGRATVWDPNDRGRGRTVETQSGGLAVMRALFRWEMWY